MGFAGRTSARTASLALGLGAVLWLAGLVAFAVQPRGVTSAETPHGFAPENVRGTAFGAPSEGGWEGRPGTGGARQHRQLSDLKESGGQTWALKGGSRFRPVQASAAAYGNLRVLPTKALYVTAYLEDLTGVMYVYCWDNATMSFNSTATVIAPSDGVDGDRFGFEFDVSATGETVVVAAVNKDAPGHSGAGAIYVFQFNASSPTGWTESIMDKLSDSDTRQIGRSVAIHEDEYLFAVGTEISRQVYIYEWDGTRYSEVQIITESENNGFGSSLAIWDDTLVVGANQATNGGTAYVFERGESGMFELVKELSGASSPSAEFGFSLSICNSVLAVGARSDTLDGIDVGAVHLFQRTNGVWNSTAFDVLYADNPQENSLFGSDVALDEDKLFVGAKEEDTAVIDSGAVFLFAYIDGEFRQVFRTTDSAAEVSSQYGIHVDIKNDTAAVGALDGDGTTLSFVRLYSLVETTPVPTVTPGPSSQPTPAPSATPSSAPTLLPVLVPTPPPSAVPTPAPTPNCAVGFILTEAKVCEACPAGYFRKLSFDVCRECPVGKFSDSGAESCTVCPGGSFSNRTAAPACTDCPGGFVIPSALTNETDHDSVEDCTECATGERSSADASECLTCSPGTYSARTTCEDCPEGRFSQVAVDFTCPACAPGTHAPAAGASSCLDCDNGKYAPNTSTVSCISCPPGRAQPTEGASDCEDCAAGFFALRPGEQSCEPCAVGFTSHPRAGNCTLCEPGYYWRFHDGGDLSRSGSGRDGCRVCPAHARCDGQLQQPKPDEGYWLDRNSAAHANRVHRCLHFDQCKGVEREDPFDPCWRAENFSSIQCPSDELQCVDGSEGILCGSCEVEHYYNQGSRECSRCTTQHAVVLVAVAVGIVALLVASYFTLRQVVTAIKQPETTGALKILFATYQIVHAILWDLDRVEWPHAMDMALRYIAVLQLDFPTECLLEGKYYFRVYIASAFPVAVLLAIATVYALRRWVCRVPRKYTNTDTPEEEPQDGAAAPPETEDDVELGVVGPIPHHNTRQMIITRRESLDRVGLDEEQGDQVRQRESPDRTSFNSESLASDSRPSPMQTIAVSSTELNVADFFRWARADAERESGSSLEEQAVRTPSLPTSRRLAAAPEGRDDVTSKGNMARNRRDSRMSPMVSITCAAASDSATTTSENPLEQAKNLVRAYHITLLEKHVTAAFTLMFLLFPPVSYLQYQGLNCVTVHRSSEESVLRVDTDISCRSSSYQTFLVTNMLIISAYTSAFLVMAVVVVRRRSILNPALLRDDSLRYKARDSDPRVRHLRFLFDDYRCSYYYFEFVDMIRRLLYIGMLPFFTSRAMRAVLGMLISLVFLFVFRELQPYRASVNNYIAASAQVVLLLMLFAAQVVESGTIKESNISDEALALVLFIIIVLLAILVVVGGIYQYRTEEHRKLSMHRSQIEIHSAVGFSPKKLGSSLAHIFAWDVARSHVLCFYYCSLEEAEVSIKSGIVEDISRIPRSWEGQGVQSGCAVPRRRGVVVTLRGPHQIHIDQLPVLFGRGKPFKSNQILLCLAVPQNMLQPEEDADESLGLRLISSDVLDSLRPTDYSNIGEEGPWRRENCNILPPAAIIRALSRMRRPHLPGKLISHARAMRRLPKEFPLSLPYSKTLDAGSYVQVIDFLEKACEHLKAINLQQSKDLCLVYHYTASYLHATIVEDGLKMAPQGYSDGGVYFSTKNPLRYEPHSPGFGARLHHDGFGPEHVASFESSRSSPHVSAESVNMCVVYAIHRHALHSVPDRPDVWLVPRMAFQSFSVMRQDGAYYLRPDRILAMIRLNLGDSALTPEESETTALRVRQIQERDDATRVALDRVRQAQDRARHSNDCDYRFRTRQGREGGTRSKEQRAAEEAQYAWWTANDHLDASEDFSEVSTSRPVDLDAGVASGTGATVATTSGSGNARTTSAVTPSDWGLTSGNLVNWEKAEAEAMENLAEARDHAYPGPSPAAPGGAESDSHSQTSASASRSSHS